MNHGDSKPSLKQQEKQKMLDELESLSRMLDEDPDADLDGDDDYPGRPVPEDIPVLKSFVDDVPVLNERFEDTPPTGNPRPFEDTPRQPPTQKTDSVDQSAAHFSTRPGSRHTGRLDDSFLDNDPLEISAAVRQHKTAPLQTLDIPVMKEVVASEARPTSPHTPEPAAPQPAARTPASPAPASARPQPAANATAAPATRPANRPATQRPAAPAAAHATAAATTPAAVAPAQTHTAASVTQPLNRFQPTTKNENPFLPRSTLEKIRENHQYDASAELRKLIQTNPLQKLSFESSPSSKEYQALRQKASQLVNEVIRANMPRMEAELRMKLEQEVDRMFKEIRKK